MTTTQNISLTKASIVSAVIAGLALVLFILPAEYNIDPTGVGEKLGLGVLNPEAEPAKAETQSNGAQDSVVLTVPASRGIEYKLSMQQFAKVTYQWMTDEGEVYVDLHGEPEGDTTGYFESFVIANASEMKGSFSVPFNGSHGWYFKNTSDKDINIQLIFEGEYVVEGLKQ